MLLFGLHLIFKDESGDGQTHRTTILELENKHLQVGDFSTLNANESVISRISYIFIQEMEIRTLHVESCNIIKFA